MDAVTARIAQQYLRSQQPDPLALAFDQQRAAITCGDRLVALQCSGRAGKTRACLLKWLEVCRRKPGFTTPYITLTRQSGKRIVWQQLKQLNAEQHLGLEFREAELVAVHPNGSKLAILGSNRDDLVDVLRGFPMPLAIIDEASFIRRNLLKRIIEDALLIRLLDLDGELWMASTPGLTPAGFFHDACTGKEKGWRVLKWTYFDNPHLPLNEPNLTAEQRLEWRINWAREERQRRGWSERSPSYVREFLGEWARDEEALVYAYDPAVHRIPAMPPRFTTHRHEWEVVLGVDYGKTNATAWSLWAYERLNPTAYCVRVSKVYGWAPSQVADNTKRWIETYSPNVVVGDAGGLGAGYIQEATVRHQLPIQAAEKQHKRAFIEFFNDALRARPQPRILVVEPDCQDLIDEWEKLDWDPRYDKSDPRWHTTENPAAENDAADASLYAFRECYAYLEGLLADDKAKASDELRRRRDRTQDPDPDDTNYQRPDDPQRYAF